MNRIKIHYQIKERPFRKALEEIFHIACNGCDLYQRTWTPPVDIFETACEIIVVADLAGTKSESIHIELGIRNLRIFGIRQERHTGTHPRYHLAEISYGTFERVLSLPCPVDKETVTAVYREGLLKIRARKLPLDQAHKIEIVQEA